MFRNLVKFTAIPLIAQSSLTDDLNENSSKIVIAKKLTETAKYDLSTTARTFHIKAGLPGLAISVSVNGKTVWDYVSGVASLEDGTPMKLNSVCRIASISKLFATTLAAEALENGKLDVDKSVQEYYPFPKKTIDNKSVDILVKQLFSHTSGLRNYQTSKFDDNEMLSKLHYKTTEEALEMFQNDPLLHQPGSKYHYSTLAFTLINGILEKVNDKPIEMQLKQLFQYFDMKDTYLDYHAPIIENRVSYYRRNEKRELINAPYVDCSYKWTGGGCLSTVLDLTKFGNIILYSYQQNSKNSNQRTCSLSSSCNQPPGFLKSQTIEYLWTPVVSKNLDDKNASSVGFSWFMKKNTPLGGRPDQPNCYYHPGGAVGASSILLIMPFPTKKMEKYDCDVENCNCCHEVLPKGIVISILTNMEGISLFTLANKIASYLFHYFYNE